MALNQPSTTRRPSDYDFIGNVFDLPSVDNPSTGRRQSVTRIPLAAEPEECNFNSKRGSLESELSLGSWMEGRRR